MNAEEIRAEMQALDAQLSEMLRKRNQLAVQHGIATGKRPEKVGNGLCKPLSTSKTGSSPAAKFAARQKQKREMDYWHFCEVEGDEETGHYASGFESEVHGSRDVSGYINAESQVFFTEEKPVFCPFSGKRLNWYKPGSPRNV